MPHGSYSLSEASQELHMLRLRCSKCGRFGQYRIDRLIKQYGLDIALRDLRHDELVQYRTAYPAVAACGLRRFCCARRWGSQAAAI